MLKKTIAYRVKEESLFSTKNVVRHVVKVCDRIIHPFGSLMRSRQAITLANSIELPVADSAIAMAFAQRQDGLVNLPTLSIVERTVQLYRMGLAQRLIFFGSSHENNITEARAMHMKAGKLGAENEIMSEVAGDIVDKELDMILLGQELDRLSIKKSYLVAHPLHLLRIYLHCKKRYPNVTFYPVEAERLYDWESNQLRCRAEILFIPWNICAFIEHFLTGKIQYKNIKGATKAIDPVYNESLNTLFWSEDGDTAPNGATIDDNEFIYGYHESLSQLEKLQLTPTDPIKVATYDISESSIKSIEYVNNYFYACNATNIYKYGYNGTILVPPSSFIFSSIGGSSDLVGIAYIDPYIWVIDNTTKKLYRIPDNVYF